MNTLVKVVRYKKEDKVGIIVPEPYPTFCKKGQVAVVFGTEKSYSAIAENELEQVDQIDEREYNRIYY